MKHNENFSHPGQSNHLNEHEAASWLGTSVFTLRKWRSEGRGPRFLKMPGAERPGRGRAGHVFYRLSDLEAFTKGLEVETEQGVTNE